MCATTARQRDLAKPVLTPEQAVAEMRRRIGEGQRCGILFGPERNGLETEEVANADAARHGARQPQFRLPQPRPGRAAAQLRVDEAGRCRARSAGSRPTRRPCSRACGPAARRRRRKEELIGFFEHIEAELDRRGFFTAPEKRPSVVQNMRTMFTRMGATEQEIRTLRGIVKALAGGKRPGENSP